MSPRSEALLDKLASHVAAEVEKADFPIDREALWSIILMAQMVYDGTRIGADATARSTFHELAEPLCRVIEILKDEANCDSAYVALGAPVSLALSPDQLALGRAIERYETLMRDLDDLARAVPPPPKRGKGRPSKTRDLRALAECLVDHWEAWTGHLPTQNWHQGEPIANAAQFVYCAVEYIDPERLGELPKVMEKIVAERRAATSAK